MDITTELQPAGDTRAAGDSLLEALVIVARHRGIHLNQTQLRRGHQLGPVDPSPDQLLKIAGACGMWAVATRLGFHDLMELKQALPAILLLKNGSAMVLRRTEAKDQPPRIILQDPLAR